VARPGEAGRGQAEREVRPLSRRRTRRRSFGAPSVCVTPRGRTGRGSTRGFRPLWPLAPWPLWPLALPSAAR
jgi:hypothetical protein